MKPTPSTNQSKQLSAMRQVKYESCKQLPRKSRKIGPLRFSKAGGPVLLVDLSAAAAAQGQQVVVAAEVNPSREQRGESSR
eukprot:13544594-Heterocapsa_arctica.AAC.1